MKGLILSYMDKKEEAYEFVKAGLKNDVRSHVCWHVYGLLHRSDRNYKEAIKCYLNALRIDNDNQQILRDLSWLQVQLHDTDGFIETRRKLLVARPAVKQNWFSYAVANYIGAQYSTANDVTNKFLESSNETHVPYELSELLLFQNQCIEAQNNYEGALSHLEDHSAQIVDQLSVRTKKAELLLLLQRFEEASAIWKGLLASQKDNYRFHCGLQLSVLKPSVEVVKEMLALTKLDLPCSVMALSAEEKRALLETYQSLPPSRSAKKIQLYLYDDEEFAVKLDEYYQNMIRDGVPALYSDFFALVSVAHPTKAHRKITATSSADIIGNPVTAVTLRLLDGYIANLRAHSSFTEAPAEEVPTCLMWALYFRAHVHYKSGNVSLSLDDINAAIEHTPTGLDLYMLKARILKSCGDYESAATIADYCRSLDLQDRYLNNKATKYLLKANKIDTAMDTIAMFTKHDGDPQRILFDLQCIWYELEIGEAYMRENNHALALKKFYAVEKHFADFLEDQFDFHSYCIRKVTLRAYLSMLEQMKVVCNHKYFLRAAKNMLRIQLQRHDHPATHTDDTEVDMSNMTAAERKREKAKQKKMAKKEAAVPAPEEKKNSNNKPAMVSKDDDPKGEKIMAKDPLEEAGLWSHSILRQNCKDCEVLALVAQVMIRRKKFLPALRALVQGTSTDPNHPDIVVATVFFAQSVATASLSPIVKESIDSQLVKLIGSNGVEAFYEKYALFALSSSLEHRVGAAKCMQLLYPQDAMSRACAMLENETLIGVSVLTCVNTIKVFMFSSCRLSLACST